MKRFSLLLMMCLLAAGGIFAQSVGSTMYVAVKTVSLKSSTWFFAGTKGTLAYGSQVKVLAVNGKWVQVQSAAQTSLDGWTESANLTSKRITASSGTTSASASEIALAGKGFNEEIEGVYKSQNALDYNDVDVVEAIVVPIADLQKFVVEGHLAGAQEGK
jgi:spermidine/putrescine-binding protein